MYVFNKSAAGQWNDLEIRVVKVVYLRIYPNFHSIVI